MGPQKFVPYKPYVNGVLLRPWGPTFLSVINSFILQGGDTFSNCHNCTSLKLSTLPSTIWCRCPKVGRDSYYGRKSNSMSLLVIPFHNSRFSEVFMIHKITTVKPPLVPATSLLQSCFIRLEGCEWGRNRRPRISSQWMSRHLFETLRRRVEVREGREEKTDFCSSLTYLCLVRRFYTTSPFSEHVNF